MTVCIETDWPRRRDPREAAMTPTTEAGKRLLGWLDKSFEEPVIASATYRAFRPLLGITTIEAEARTAALRDLRAALDGLVAAASTGGFGFCDRTDRREACNLPDCAACNFRAALATAKEAGG